MVFLWRQCRFGGLRGAVVVLVVFVVIIIRMAISDGVAAGSHAAVAVVVAVAAAFFAAGMIRSVGHLVVFVVIVVVIVLVVGVVVFVVAASFRTVILAVARFVTIASRVTLCVQHQLMVGCFFGVFRKAYRTLGALIVGCDIVRFVRLIRERKNSK